MSTSPIKESSNAKLFLIPSTGIPLELSSFLLYGDALILAGSSSKPQVKISK
jgi:hypothetical protein